MTELEKEIENIKHGLIGKTITNLYHTKVSERHELLPGANYVLYFRTIFELDHLELYDLWKSYINKWISNEELIPVTNEHWNVPDTKFFIDQKIKDISVINGQIFLVLENDMAIEHAIDYGDTLRIKLYEELIKEASR